MTITITFSPNVELYACSRGLFEISSGNSPHHPDEVSAVRRNSKLSHQLHETHQERVRLAAARGEQALKATLAGMFVAAGRACDGYWQ